MDIRSVTRVSAIRSTASTLCKSGKTNEYRAEFYRGHGASKKDKTWNSKKHQHNCCKSKVGWRHKASCSTLNPVDEGNEKWKALGN